MDKKYSLYTLLSTWLRRSYTHSWNTMRTVYNSTSLEMTFWVTAIIWNIVKNLCPQISQKNVPNHMHQSACSLFIKEAFKHNLFILMILLIA